MTRNSVPLIRLTRPETPYSLPGISVHIILTSDGSAARRSPTRDSCVHTLDELRIGRCQCFVAHYMIIVRNTDGVAHLVAITHPQLHRAH